MNRSFTPFQPDETHFRRAAGAPTPIHTHPDDVASDPTLTTPQKRALLASWISDARAVENAPALRRIDSGAIVEVDSIRRALASLDEGAPEREDRQGPQPSPRRSNVIWSLLRRAGRARNSNDSDDDPPPAPAGMRIPFPPNFVAAHGLRPEAGLAYAA